MYRLLHFITKTYRIAYYLNDTIDSECHRNLAQLCPLPYKGVPNILYTIVFTVAEILRRLRKGISIRNNIYVI